MRQGGHLMKLANVLRRHKDKSHGPREGKTEPEAVKAEEQKQRAFEDKDRVQERATFNGPLM
jgi:hypothetical protein